MEELLDLRRYIEERRYTDALALVDELEEMSRDDKINKIRSYAKILLLHLVKQAAENRTTRSWDLSVRNALQEIFYVNQRRRAGGAYLGETELSQVIHEAYLLALEAAALEAFEGRYDADELDTMVNRTVIEERALMLIQQQSQPT